MHTGGVSLTAQIDLLRGAVDAAREAIVVDGGAPGDHVEVVVEDDNSAAHYFTADLPGYRGWRWCAVVALAAASRLARVTATPPLPPRPAEPVTVAEAVVRFGGLGRADLGKDV